MKILTKYSQNSWVLLPCIWKWQTLFDSCEIHLSSADRRSGFHLSVLPGLETSAWFCRHFRKCFIRSDIAPVIATDACCLAPCAICVVTLTISACRRGCLTTFLWSKCLTNICNNKWELSPDVQVNHIYQLYPHMMFKRKKRKHKIQTWFLQKWLQIHQNMIGKWFIWGPMVLSIKTLKKWFKHSTHCCSFLCQSGYITQANPRPVRGTLVGIAEKMAQESNNVMAT